MAGTKEKLMDAALDLFSQKGYDATSVDEIAESIGIKGPNIYKYFKGKQGLFDELLIMSEEGYRKKMGIDARRMKKIKTGSDLKKFSMGQITFTLNDETVKKLRKMYTIEQYRNEKLASVATFHQYTNLMEMFTAIFADMMESGAMKRYDPELLALDYLSPVTVLIQLCDREPDRKDDVLKKIEAFIDLFVETYCVK